MREVIRLVQDIRSFLAGAPGAPPAEALAPAYARFREEAANRLEACAAMLEKGSEYQVLQLAETEIPLLDLVAQLTFAEEPEWVAYCGDHQLAVPRPMDAKAVQALNNIYSKGISANSPLYRDYRAAVSSRDDEKALQIIRSITRLNPSDTNAKAELDRLKNKKTLTKLEELKPLLAARDADAVINILDEVEELSSGDKLGRHEIYNQAVDFRKATLRERGEKEIVALLDSSEEQKREGDWRSVSISVARIRALEMERHIVLAPDQVSRLTALERYVDERRLDAREQVEFNRSLAALSNYGDKLDTRLLTSATLTLREAQRWEAGFAEQWKKVELYQRAVPSGELARLQGIGSAIRREADRLRGAKAAKNYSLAGVAAVLLCAGAWAGYVAWQALQYEQQLDDLRSRHLAIAAGNLVEEIPAAAPWGATSFPPLRAKMEEIRQWVKNERLHTEQTETQLAELEKADHEQYVGLSPTVLKQKLTSVTENVQSLANDMNTCKDRLAQVQNKVDLHFTTLRDKATASTQAQLTRLSKLAAKLSFDRPGKELESGLASIDPKLTEIEKHLAGEIPELRMPPDVEAAAKKLRGQVEPFSKELAEVQKVTQRMAEAENLDAYRAALKDYSKLRILEASAAAPMLANFPTEDKVASALLFAGDEGGWEAAKKDKALSSPFRPIDVLGKELTELASLRDDPMLTKVWEVTVTTAFTGKSRTVWSKGKLSETNSGLEKRWEGSLYDPSTFPLKPVFTDYNIVLKQFSEGKTSGEMVASVKPSANQRLLASLNLNRITDPNGDHYETPLLQPLDEVLRSTEGTVLARAYVFQRLCQMLKLRPYEWGLHYCPTLAEDMAKLETILDGHSLHDDDWMAPDICQRWEPALTKFLKEAATHSPYLQKAGAYRKLVLNVRDAGITYVGYINDKLEAHVKSKGVLAHQLWAIAEHGGGPVRLTPFENGAATPEVLKAAQKWSPLFLIAIDPNAVLPTPQGAPGAAASPAAGGAVPVTPSPADSKRPQSRQANAGAKRPFALSN